MQQHTIETAVSRPSITQLCQQLKKKKETDEQRTVTDLYNHWQAEENGSV